MHAAESTFPDFFADAPQITLRDPLAEFLGAARGGVMTYRYADAVRLAGHSCPTVAGAWLRTMQGLRALYGQETPVRGEIEVLMQGGREDGANGVIATVVQLITGAAPETGFHGIAGRFSRHQLLRFDQPVQGTLGLRRQDTGRAVQVELDASVVSDEGGRGEHSSFTGAFVGVVAHDLTGQGWTADVTRFRYAPKVG